MKLQQYQYNNIGIVAKHCDNKKLSVAETEASSFDLGELFCDYWQEIESIVLEVDAYIENPQLPKPDNYEDKVLLLNGGIYTDCAGKVRQFEGIYKILAYYSYSRYIILNGFSDTPNGLVQKTNEFSIPKSLKELEMFADKYRNMGRISFDRTVGFICKNSSIFEFNNCPTNGCGCGSEKCGKTKAKGYGLRSRNINK